MTYEFVRRSCCLRKPSKLVEQEAGDDVVFEEYVGIFTNNFLHQKLKPTVQQVLRPYKSLAHEQRFFFFCV